MKLTKDILKKIIKEEIITERLKRFKVFVRFPKDCLSF